MKFSYTKKLRFILLGAYFKKRAEPPISQERLYRVQRCFVKKNSIDFEPKTNNKIKMFSLAIM